MRRGLIHWEFRPEQAAERLALEGNLLISHEPSTGGYTQISAKGVTYGGNCVVRNKKG
jgi:hypothetical protein